MSLLVVLVLIVLLIAFVGVALVIFTNVELQNVGSTAQTLIANFSSDRAVKYASNVYLRPFELAYNARDFLLATITPTALRPNGSEPISYNANTASWALQAQVLGDNATLVNASSRLSEALLVLKKQCPLCIKIYLGFPDGRFISWANGNADGTQGSIWQFHSVSCANGCAQRTIYSLQGDDAHTPVSGVNNTYNSYDPTVRPWYTPFAAAGGGPQALITPPYIFALTRKPGVTMAVPILARAAAGQAPVVVAVIGVDVECSSLAREWPSVRIAKTGYAVLYTSSGALLAGPEGLPLATATNQVLSTSDVADPVVRALPIGGAAPLTSDALVDVRVAGGTLYARKVVAADISRILELPNFIPDCPWCVGAVVFDADFVDGVRHAMLVSAVVPAVVYACMLVLAAALFLFVVVRPIRAVADALWRAAHMDLNIEEAARVASIVSVVRVRETLHLYDAYRGMARLLSEFRSFLPAAALPNAGPAPTVAVATRITLGDAPIGGADDLPPTPKRAAQLASSTKVAPAARTAAAPRATLQSLMDLGLKERDVSVILLAASGAAMREVTSVRNEMAASAAGERMDTILAEAFYSAVQALGGCVFEIAHGRMFAAWNALTPLSLHVGAVAAALADLRARADDVAVEYGVQVRISVDTGRALVGKVAAAGSRAFTVVGGVVDTVNILDAHLATAPTAAATGAATGRSGRGGMKCVVMASPAFYAAASHLLRFAPVVAGAPGHAMVGFHTMGDAGSRWRKVDPPRSLGTGANGDVFLGRDSEGVEVAIKVYSRAGGGGDRSGAERSTADRSSLGAVVHVSPATASAPMATSGAFSLAVSGGGSAALPMDVVAEVAAMSALTRPELLRVVGLCVDLTGAPALVLELAPGGSLDSRVREAAPTAQQLRGWCEPILQGLQALHDSGFPHLDLKPQNILFGAGDALKISDFGTAGIAGLSGARERKKTRRVPTSGGRGLGTGATPLGTPQFMAPEQARCQAVPASDVWAFGITVAYCVLGTLPHADPDRVRLLRLLASDPASLKDGFPLVAGPGALVPPVVAEFILPCLRIDPAARPAPRALLRAEFMTSTARDAELDAGIAAARRQLAQAATEAAQAHQAHREIEAAALAAAGGEPGFLFGEEVDETASGKGEGD